jgi:hypothetical protein
MLPKRSLSQSSRPRPLSARALACHIAGERMMAAFARLQVLAEKGGFNPDQPRVPAGNPDGGRWTGGDGSASGRQPGIGDNGGPKLGPPDTPKEPPKDKASRTQAAKALAKHLARQALRRAGPVGAAFMVIEAGHWLYTEYPSIRSYQDEPKTLAELQQNAGKRRPGYEDHHIVEQGAGGREGFSRSQIEGADNVVSVPKYRHHEITGWYNKPNKNFGMQTPRNYLRGKGWSEHVRVGRLSMREFGVLK